MIMRYVKNPMSARLDWLLSAKLVSTILHHQSSGASLWRGNYASKLLATVGIRLYGAALKRDTSFRKCTRSAMFKGSFSKMACQSPRVAEQCDVNIQSINQSTKMACQVLWNTRYFTVPDTFHSDVPIVVDLTLSTRAPENKDTECIFRNGRILREETRI
ncbi:hypothetical protein TNCV_3015771 [Trichonephila clavipes]|nr:hypothetical protein TNCV_3015771 [Trichonephila clavipes]